MNDNSKLMALYATTVFKLTPHVKLPDSFAIITAHNPQGVICDTHTNKAYNLALKHLLATHGDIKQALPIIGCAPDMSHQEASYLIDGSKSSAFEIAKQFKQNAFYWVEDDQLTIVPVLLPAVTTTHIGSFNNRLV